MKVRRFLARTFPVLFFFILCFFTYFYFGTKGTFRIRQELDHYNAFAKALREGHLDLRNPPITDELSFYKGKWYFYYGPLPALFIMFLQIASNKEFIPTLYPNVLVASLNVSIVYLLFRKFREEFFPKSKPFLTTLLTLVFAFGTVHFWLGSRSGIWFVAQIYSFFVSTIGLLFLIKKKRTVRNYFLSVFFISLCLFIRPNAIMLLSLPLLLFIFDYKGKIMDRENLKELVKILTPAVFFVFLFALYNYYRFKNPLETGLNLQEFHYRFIYIYEKRGGWFSLANIPVNLWFMILEIPKLTFDPILNKFNLITNPEGNSIFFLTPVFLFIFKSKPWIKYKNKRVIQPFLFSLWASLLLISLPILLLSGTGWSQFGYRYSLDFTVILLLLSFFGIKGRINFLFLLASFFSIFIQAFGNLIT